MPHLLNQLEDSIIGDSVVDEIGVFPKVDDPLAPEYVQVLGDIGIGGFDLFSDVSDRHLMFLKQAENLEPDGV